jgi:hypothetical protein
MLEEEVRRCVLDGWWGCGMWVEEVALGCRFDDKGRDQLTRRTKVKGRLVNVSQSSMSRKRRLLQAFNSICLLCQFNSTSDIVLQSNLLSKHRFDFAQRKE